MEKRTQLGGYSYGEHNINWCPFVHQLCSRLDEHVAIWNGGAILFGGETSAHGAMRSLGSKLHLYQMLRCNILRRWSAARIFARTLASPATRCAQRSTEALKKWDGEKHITLSSYTKSERAVAPLHCVFPFQLCHRSHRR